MSKVISQYVHRATTWGYTHQKQIGIFIAGGVAGIILASPIFPEWGFFARYQTFIAAMIALAAALHSIQVSRMQRSEDAFVREYDRFGQFEEAVIAAANGVEDFREANRISRDLIGMPNRARWYGTSVAVAGFQSGVIPRLYGFRELADLEPLSRKVTEHLGHFEEWVSKCREVGRYVEFYPKAGIDELVFELMSMSNEITKRASEARSC